MTVLLQLSDCHLGGQLEGHPTPEESLLRLGRALAARHFDGIILTGDLIDTPSDSAVDLLRTVLAQWDAPHWLLPGNHDHPHFLARHWPEQFVQGGLWRRLGDLTLALLDSHWPGHVEGRLGADRLDWLRQHLEEGDEPTLIFLHHPPVAVGSAWIDTLGLVDATELADCLRPHARRIAGIFFGHVHQAFTGLLAGIPCYGSPSTWVQFAPDREEFAYDHRPPGAREIHWNGHTLETTIRRLETR